MSRDIWFNSIWINVFLDNNNNCIKTIYPLSILLFFLVSKEKAK
jgi:hypothetical protein